MQAQLAVELGRDSGLWALMGWGVFESQHGCDIWEGVETRD